jgi:hypothetical protein
MEQAAAGHPFHQIHHAGVHLVDLVGLFQLGQPIGAASRAAGIRAEAVLKNPRNVFLAIATLAVVDGRVAEPFEKRSVNPPQPSSALAAFQHSWHRL